MPSVRKADQPLVASITKAIDENPAAAMRAIVIIGDNQTADEINQQATLEHNGIGFTGVDAKYGTWLYRQIKANIPLSQKSLDGCKRIAKKYARTQLLVAAKAKQARKESNQ